LSSTTRPVRIVCAQAKHAEASITNPARISHRINFASPVIIAHNAAGRECLHRLGSAPRAVRSPVIIAHNAAGARVFAPLGERAPRCALSRHHRPQRTAGARVQFHTQAGLHLKKYIRSPAMLPLFDSGPGFPRDALARRLEALARENIWIGTSSWKYDGWLGQIYSRERYLARGKFSQKRFEAECLAEYAETFPIVCGDFSFYQFPAPEYWQKLFGSAGGALKFALKVPEEVTVEVFPKHARYGARAGRPNQSYLNAEALAEGFLEPLTPYRDRAAALIFEFGTRGASPREFVTQIDPFLDALPATFRYAVEVRNAEYLEPRYFDCLRSHGVSHVLNAWTRMPSLAEHMAIPGAFPADFTVVRALLRQGRSYETAVAQFQPYSEIRDPNPEARDALRTLIRRMREERRAAYIFVNNRLEGNAPETIRAVVDT
jgi:uncharacterized protein YecE (DUF72 family)